MSKVTAKKVDKTEKSEPKKNTKEAVLEQTLKEIRGKFGQGSIMMLGENLKAHVEVIPTGILPLDVALGIGGLPKGRIVEIFGPEGSGKTTASLYAIAEAQKAGGIAAFIDAEHALDPRLAASLGVDIEHLYLSQPDSGEQALAILDSLVRSSAVDIIVIDSVAALVPQSEIDGNIGEAQIGAQARLMSFALRRLASIISKTNTVVVFINQLRSKINTGYGAGPTEQTTGGRALKFYSSVRIEVKRGKSITKGDVNVGHELLMKVVKNKQFPPFRTAHTSLIYGKGVPKGIAVLDMAIDFGVIKRKGSWIAYKGENLGQGKESVASYLEEHPDLFAELTKEVLALVTDGNVAIPVVSEADIEGAVAPIDEEKAKDQLNSLMELEDED